MIQWYTCRSQLFSLTLDRRWNAKMEINAYLYLSAFTHRNFSFSNSMMENSRTNAYKRNSIRSVCTWSGIHHCGARWRLPPKIVHSFTHSLFHQRMISLRLHACSPKIKTSSSTQKHFKNVQAIPSVSDEHTLRFRYFSLLLFSSKSGLTVV